MIFLRSQFVCQFFFVRIELFGFLWLPSTETLNKKFINWEVRFYCRTKWGWSVVQGGLIYRKKTSFGWRRKIRKWLMAKVRGAFARLTIFKIMSVTMITIHCLRSYKVLKSFILWICWVTGVRIILLILCFSHPINWVFYSGFEFSFIQQAVDSLTNRP